MTETENFFVKTKTKTLIFVLDVPRDQDLGLENYTTTPLQQRCLWMHSLTSFMHYAAS